MDGFRFTLSYRPRIQDINYGGHVSYAAVLYYFQDARIAYLANLGPFSEMDVGEGCALIIPEAHVRYRAEMFLGDELEIGVRVTELRRSGLRMEYRIERSGTLTAEGETPLVIFHYPTRQVRRVPEALRVAVASFEGLAIPA
ncbi:acyl-CoA thioesterase [Deferrisoma sp.]